MGVNWENLLIHLHQLHIVVQINPLSWIGSYKYSFLLFLKNYLGLISFYSPCRRSTTESIGIMVNSKSRSTIYASPKANKEKRYPPTTPPTVSVGAIKRSLEHTPSPRRFKKLRQRKLQERFPVSLTKSNLAALGPDERVNRGEYGDSGVGVQQ
jgi:hypothetical protein